MSHRWGTQPTVEGRAWTKTWVACVYGCGDRRSVGLLSRVWAEKGAEGEAGRQTFCCFPFLLSPEVNSWDGVHIPSGPSFSGNTKKCAWPKPWDFLSQSRCQSKLITTVRNPSFGLFSIVRFLRLVKKWYKTLTGSGIILQNKIHSERSLSPEVCQLLHKLGGTEVQVAGPQVAQ